MRLLISLSLSVFCGSAFAANVFIVQSYHAEYAWDAEYIQSITDILGPSHQYSVRALDSKREPAAVWEQTAGQVVTEILATVPDIVIVGDDNAMRSVAVPLDGSGIPVVFLGVNGTLEQYGLTESDNVTGVLERPFFDISVRHLRKVAPDNKRFLVLMDDSITMRNAVSDRFGEERQVNLQGTHLDFLLTNDAIRWQQAVQSAHTKDYDAIVVGTYHTLRYADDSYYPAADAMTFARANSEVPIFSFWNIFVGDDKAIGGYVITAYEEGKAAARIAQLILKGVSVASLPPSASLAGQYVYSQSGLERWGIELTALTRTQTLFVD